MTIEEKLKKHILTKHKSIREFVKCADLPYSTVDGILKRGIANSSIGNVLKICKALQISADELANNRIVPIKKEQSSHILFSDIPEMLEYMKINRNEFSDLTIDNKPLSDLEYDTVLNCLTLSIEFVRDLREKKKIKS